MVYHLSAGDSLHIGDAVTQLADAPDVRADIVTAPGIWSGPDIRIFDGKTLTNKKRHVPDADGDVLTLFSPRALGLAHMYQSSLDTGEPLIDVILVRCFNNGLAVSAHGLARLLTRQHPGKTLSGSLFGLTHPADTKNLIPCVQPATALPA